MDIEEEFLEDALTQDNYSRKDPETFKECVLRAIEKCRIEMSKERTKGKTIFVQRDGISIPLTIPDQRKVVEGCINVLYDLLIYTFDEQGIKVFERIKESINNLDRDYLKEYIKLEQYVPSKNYAINNQQLPSEAPLGNTFIQRKEDERVELYRNMFQELILLYKRKNELKNTRTAQA